CRHPSTAVKNRLSIFALDKVMSATDRAHEFEEQRTIQTTHSKICTKKKREWTKKRKRVGGICNHTNTAGSHIGGNHNWALAGFEFTKNPISFSLLLVAVNC